MGILPKVVVCGERERENKVILYTGKREVLISKVNIKLLEEMDGKTLKQKKQLKGGK